MIILITGATGFIGTQLLNTCLFNNWIVHVVARVIPVPKNEHPNCFWHCYHGCIQDLVKIMDLAKPDIVIHLASYFVAEHQTYEINSLVESNILFGTQLLEAMVKTKTKRFINTSTSWQHFNNSSYDPVSLYAATKQAFEDIARFYSKTGEMSIINLKLFDTYGPSDKRKKIFPLLKEMYKKIELNQDVVPLQLSEGQQLINIVHVQDVVSAYLCAVKHIMNNIHFDSDCYGIASEELYSLKQIVELIMQLTKVELPILWGARPYRAREVMTPWDTYNVLPGWKQTIPLKRGIIDYLNS